MNSGERTYTGMRGVGALIVAFYHFRLEIPDQVAFNATTLNIFTELHVFLDMFFLVSGVVIFTVYSNLFEKGTSRSAIKKYLMARLARIYPLHIFALLLVLGGIDPRIPMTIGLILQRAEASHLQISDLVLLHGADIEDFRKLRREGRKRIMPDIRKFWFQEVGPKLRETTRTPEGPLL